MTPSYLTIIAVVGIVFLIALYCWLSGCENPLEDEGDGLPYGDRPALPADFAPFHASQIAAGGQHDPA